MLSTYRPSAKYGVSDKRKFKVYDKVFARMRTFAPWPAKIMPQQFPRNNLNNMLRNCVVYFYGTDEIGECPFANIYDYESNKERFQELYQSSSKKDPRMENALIIAERLDDGSRDDMEEPFAEEVLEFTAPLNVLWEREQKKMEKKKRKTRRSDKDTQDDDAATQPPGDESQDDPDDWETTEDDEAEDDDDNDDDYDTKSPGRSRTRVEKSRRQRGRKQKTGSQKKATRGQSRSRSVGPDDESQAAMSDTEDIDDFSDLKIRTEEPAALLVEYCLKEMYTLDVSFQSLTKLEDAAAYLIYRATVITAILPDGNLVELPLRPKSSVGGGVVPVTAANFGALLSRTKEFENLAATLTRGHHMPLQYSSLVLGQLSHEHQAKLKAKRAKLEEFLTIELALLEEADELKSLLTMTVVDCKGAFKALETILMLDIRPLMLKKNPQVVKSIKMLQNYDVSKIKLRFKPNEPNAQQAMERAAERIRHHADFVMEKFASLFEYPADEMNFYRAFYLELMAFIVEIRGVPVEDVILLTD